MYWKTKEGKLIKIKDMETRHLFFTIRMFWNHFCPANRKLEPYRRYNINMRKEYILSRMEVMLNEIKTRDDIEPNWLCQLHFMYLHAGEWNENAQILIK